MYNPIKINIVVITACIKLPVAIQINAHKIAAKIYVHLFLGNPIDAI